MGQSMGTIKMRPKRQQVQYSRRKSGGNQILQRCGI